MKKCYNIPINTNRKSKYSFSEVGKELDIGRNKLLKFLRILNILPESFNVSPYYWDWFDFDYTEQGYRQYTPRITSKGYRELIKFIEKVGITNVASISLKSTYNEQALREVVANALY